jgi:glycerol-3-phosphate dehydrogenase subunit C
MEGGLNAPVRHPFGYDEPGFHDAEALDAELRRVFDVCHGCRRCFNLCDSFPRLFDLIDESETGELDSVSSEDFAPVVDACTLCDMCFMVSCPYVPPHEFNIDFPHRMLRYRSAQAAKGGIGFVDRELARTDRNGRLGGALAPLANWATDVRNRLVRPALEKLAGIHRDAALPRFQRRTFEKRARAEAPRVNAAAPAHGRKVALFSTCFANWHDPDIAMAALKVLAHNGVEVEVVYPGCCGMPELEHAAFKAVAARARRTAAALAPWIDKGYDIVAPVPSCALMLKFEWPLAVPGDESVAHLAAHTSDITQYIVDIAETEGLADGLTPLPGGIAVHLACHARAQNMGAKAVDMLKLIPEADLEVIERCSGHGGSWGVKTEFFPVALKVGRPAARKAMQSGKAYLASECPLAGEHLRQGMQRLVDGEDAPAPARSHHPIELFARAYGLVD